MRLYSDLMCFRELFNYSLILHFNSYSNNNLYQFLSFIFTLLTSETSHSLVELSAWYLICICFPNNKWKFGIELASDDKSRQLKFNYIFFILIDLPLCLPPIYENAGCK